jgi:hypothetical protein
MEEGEDGPATVPVWVAAASTALAVTVALIIAGIVLALPRWVLDPRLRRRRLAIGGGYGDDSDS